MTATATPKKSSYKPAPPTATMTPAQAAARRDECGSAEELRELQREAESMRTTSAAKCEALRRRRAAEIEALQTEYAARIAEASGESANAALAASRMAAARRETISHAPEHLREQHKAARQAAITAFHARLSELETAISLREGLLRDSQTTEGMYRLVQAGRGQQNNPSMPLYCGAAVESQTANGGAVVRIDEGAIRAHIHRSVSTWQAELPRLREQLADVQRERQTALDFADDELLDAVCQGI